MKQGQGLNSLQKYAGLDSRYMFVPIAFENLGVPSESTRHLLAKLGRRLTESSSDSRETDLSFSTLFSFNTAL